MDSVRLLAPYATIATVDAGDFDPADACERLLPATMVVTRMLAADLGAVRTLRSFRYGGAIPILTIAVPQDPAWHEVTITLPARNGAGVLRGLIFCGRAIRKMYHAAKLDGLTGVLSRSFLEDKVSTEIARAHRYCVPLSLTVFDVDNFKAVNDRRGHAAGDRLLRAIGRAASRIVRDSDHFGRIGGDEFALLLIGCDAGQASSATARVKHAIEKAAGQSIACGTATLSMNERPADLWARADRNLYASKSYGRASSANPDADAVQP